MRFNDLLRFCCGSIVGAIIPIFDVAALPVGSLQARAEVVSNQSLTIQEFNQLVKKSVQFMREGQYAASAKIWQQIVSDFEKILGSDHPKTAIALNNLAIIHAKQGLYSKAASLYLRALAIVEKTLGPDHPETAKALNNLAITHVNQGLYSKAESLSLRALAIAEKTLGPDHPETVISLRNLANVYINQGFLGKAEPMLERTLIIREKTLSPEHLDIAISLNSMARLYTMQGLYSKAEPLYRRALMIKETTLSPEHPELATTLNNLAELYARQGLYGKAEPMFERALIIREKALGSDHPKTAISLNSLADLYASQGLYGKAELLCLRALSIVERSLQPEHPELLRTINNLAYFYANQGLFGKADSFYQRALIITEKALGSDHPKTAVVLSNLAILYVKQGLYSKAEKLWRHVLRINFQVIQREVPFLTRLDRLAYMTSTHFYLDWPFSFLSQRKTGKALALFSRLNRQGLLAEIERRQFQFASQPDQQHQEVILELRTLNQQLSSLAIKPDQYQRLRERQQQLEKQLYNSLPQLKPRIIEVGDVASALPTDSVLIEFQRYQTFDVKQPLLRRWGKARYLAMVLRPNGAITVVQLGEADGLEKAITSAVSTAQEAQSDAPEQFAKASQLILEPLRQATAGASTWFVSPDGELNRLPFAALPMPDGGGYLSEAVDLNMITTGRELLDRQKTKASAKTAALVVANPAYDRSGRGGNTALIASEQAVINDARQRSSDMRDRLQWDPLPATAVEGESVKAITGGTLLVQQMATAEAVKRTHAPKVLHLASHAFYLPNKEEQQPQAEIKAQLQASSQGLVQTKNLKGESALLRSGIALAGANQPNADPNDDGYLTALEVAQLDWEGTELVVISACESGLGDLKVGEGVYGLKRAIAVAGARSSLLTLWKVDDDATRLFMESFYKRLKQGEGKASALAATQKEFRESPELSAFRHPYYWAAFQLSGDGGPVKGL